MAVDHVKSTSITNLDASPSVPNTAGEGAGAALKNVLGTAIVLASGSTDSTYQLCRVPSNAKIKNMFFESAAQAAGTMDIGVYYATDGQGGKPLTLLAANAIDQDFFASAYAVTSLSQPTSIINESGTNTGDKRNQPLWQALGLTTDPGGSFDICATIVTAVTTGTGRITLSIDYTD